MCVVVERRRCEYALCFSVAYGEKKTQSNEFKVVFIVWCEEEVRQEKSQRAGCLRMPALQRIVTCTFWKLPRQQLLEPTRDFTFALQQSGNFVHVLA